MRDANNHKSLTWNMHTLLGGGCKGITFEPAVVSV